MANLDLDCILYPTRVDQQIDTGRRAVICHIIWQEWRIKKTNYVLQIYEYECFIVLHQYDRRKFIVLSPLFNKITLIYHVLFAEKKELSLLTCITWPVNHTRDVVRVRKWTIVRNETNKHSTVVVQFVHDYDCNTFDNLFNSMTTLGRHGYEWQELCGIWPGQS